MSAFDDARVTAQNGHDGHESGTLYRQLPYFVQSAPLIGRAAELAEITGLLADPAVRLVTITGRSGVGKTRLALEAARTLDARHPGTAFAVSLASVSDPDLVLTAIADQLEVSAGPGASLADVVVRWLHRSARYCCWTTSSTCSAPPASCPACWTPART